MSPSNALIYRTEPSIIERDDINLDYMHARYYLPYVGRFLSVDKGRFDPLEPQSWNRYSYTTNAPLNYTDPNGREKLRFELTTAIPFRTVTVPTLSGVTRFHGDLGRNTYRTKQTFVVETDSSQQSNGNPIFAQKNAAGVTRRSIREATSLRRLFSHR
jgi:RHS repeat-associated protein